jgi:serine/threonine protein kinase
MSATVQEYDDSLPKEGDVIADKYRVERLLGQGGMGVVIAAQHLTLRQTVAVKLLRPEAMDRADAVERFLREGRAARSITSEHIARVHDVGTLDSGQPFMVMEYLVGSDLDDIIKNQGRLPISEAVDYILQACEAIAEAHMLGIVHRDLKPANIFVTRRVDGSPLVKVLDFGLSKVTKTDTLEPSLTTANTVMGSPYYMSPEQVRSLKSIDARADVWALGVILYQLISGKRPFQEESLGALFVMIGAEPPAPIRSYVPDIPQELEALVYRCLEKAPANRFQSVAELARGLATFASDGARPSIERILRTLNDLEPLVVRPPAPSLPEIDRPSSPQVQIVPPGPHAIPQARRSGVPPPPFDPAAQAQSQSSPALAQSVHGPATENGSRTGRHDKSAGSRAMVYVIATALALVGGGATTLLLMRPNSGAGAGAGAPTAAIETAQTAVKTAEPPPPTIVPAPTATATATAEPTAAPTSSASSAPGAGAKKGSPLVKPKKIDPLDKR